MIKKILFVFLFSSFFTVYSQNEIDITERNGKLFFKLGADYRITPFYNGQPKYDGLRTSTDSQVSGAALFYGLEFFPWNDLSFNFHHSFHYTLFYLESFDGTMEDIRGEASTNALFFDYHFFINYYFQIFDESEFYVRVGRTLFNRNSNYTTNDALFQGDEFVLGSSTQGSFNFQAYNFGLGFKKNRVEVMLGLYLAEDTPYTTGVSTFQIPYFNLAYTIGKM